jgi:phosphatidylserine/phosphatidylglycerophosphate/cardiolipin synthase-like enzyme
MRSPYTDKRSMTIAEIRDSFIESPYFRRLAELQSQVQRSYEQPQSATYLRILTSRSVERFLQRYISISGQQVLLIISPFIGNLKSEAYELEDVIKKSQTEKCRIYVITRAPQDGYHKEGLAVLGQGENVEIRYNPDIHAKLYVSWNRLEEESFAMFGSGNLTSSGTSYNLELGMMILSRGYGRKLVRELYRWGDNLRTQSNKIKSIGSKLS